MAHKSAGPPAPLCTCRRLACTRGNTCRCRRPSAWAAGNPDLQCICLICAVNLLLLHTDLLGMRPASGRAQAGRQYSRAAAPLLRGVLARACLPGRSMHQCRAASAAQHETHSPRCGPRACRCRPRLALPGPSHDQHFIRVFYYRLRPCQHAQPPQTCLQTDLGRPGPPASQALPRSGAATAASTARGRAWRHVVLAGHALLFRGAGRRDAEHQRL